jgi:O-antigen/teichoic acid export membrane protein
LGERGDNDRDHGQFVHRIAYLGWAAPVALGYALYDRLRSAGECVFGQITYSAGRVFQALERMKVTALLSLLTNALRATLAGTLLWTVHRTTAREWVWVTLEVSVISSVTAVALVTKHFGKPQFNASLLKARACEGVVFALSYSTGGVLNDVDKAMLGHYGMNLANGIYSMAYRVVDVGMMPISAVHTAAFPRFFQKGVEGAGATRVFAQRILKRTAPTGLALAAAMWVAAGLIPRVLGSSFAKSTAALRWLSMLPVFRSFHLSAGDALTGAGKQKLRLMTQTVAAAFNFGANLWLIPRFGWLGAAWSSLMTDAALAAMNWTALICATSKSPEDRLEREPIGATH